METSTPGRGSCEFLPTQLPVGNQVTTPLSNREDLPLRVNLRQYPDSTTPLSLEITGNDSTQGSERPSQERLMGVTPILPLALIEDSMQANPDPPALSSSLDVDLMRQILLDPMTVSLSGLIVGRWKSFLTI